MAKLKFAKVLQEYTFDPAETDIETLICRATNLRRTITWLEADAAEIRAEIRRRAPHCYELFKDKI